MIHFERKHTLFIMTKSLFTPLFLCLLTIPLCIGCNQKDDTGMTESDSMNTDNAGTNNADKTDTVEINYIYASSLKGKSMAFLGGSQCYHAFEAGGSEMYDRFPLREALEKLGVSEIRVMARDGAGLTTPVYSHETPNICRQAEMMGEDRKLHDFYIIWLQTNDLTSTMGMRNGVGDVSDKATLDDVKRDQQSFTGALSYVIDKLVGLNYDGRICIISPTRCFLYKFSKDDPGYIFADYGYGLEGEQRQSLYSIVKTIHEVANYHGVPFLDLFSNSGLTIGNWTDHDKVTGIWYTTHLDGTHLNPRGYDRITPAIINFLANY